MRLTFVGDISCDKPLLKAAKKKTYNFSEVFQMDSIFDNSDLVIGNLETCFGGGNRFNFKPYHYNSPDSFCEAIKHIGVDLVSTANNHCFDEGREGLMRTIQVLKRNGIEATGTFDSEGAKRYLVKEIDNTKVAFYSLTYAVNSCYEASVEDDLFKYINIIGYRNKSYSHNFVRQIWQRYYKPKIVQLYKKYIKGSTLVAYTDSLEKAVFNKTWFDYIQNDIKEAKKESDIICVLLHIGGQFNENPGDFSEFIVNKLCDMGVDLVIGHHPHTIQKIEKREKTLIAWSLGAFSISPSGDYLIHECLPEYGLVLNVDIVEKKIQNYSFKIIKNIENKDHCLYIRDMSKYKTDECGSCKDNLDRLYRRIRGK